MMTEQEIDALRQRIAACREDKKHGPGSGFPVEIKKSVIDLLGQVGWNKTSYLLQVGPSSIRRWKSDLSKLSDEPSAILMECQKQRDARQALLERVFGSDCFSCVFKIWGMNCRMTQNTPSFVEGKRADDCPFLPFEKGKGK